MIRDDFDVFYIFLMDFIIEGFLVGFFCECCGKGIVLFIFDVYFKVYSVCKFFVKCKWNGRVIFVFLGSW